VAAQVNPLKERVAQLRQTVQDGEELIQRMKGAELMAAERLKRCYLHKS